MSHPAVRDAGYVMWHDAIQTPGPSATLPAPDGTTGYGSAGTDGQRPSEPAVAEGVVGGHRSTTVIITNDQRHEMVHDQTQRADPRASTRRTALLGMLNAATHDTTFRPAAVAGGVSLGGHRPTT